MSPTPVSHYWPVSSLMSWYKQAQSSFSMKLVLKWLTTPLHNTDYCQSIQPHSYTCYATSQKKIISWCFLDFQCFHYINPLTYSVFMFRKNEWFPSFIIQNNLYFIFSSYVSTAWLSTEKSLAHDWRLWTKFCGATIIHLNHDGTTRFWSHTRLQHLHTNFGNRILYHEKCMVLSESLEKCFHVVELQLHIVAAMYDFSWYKI